MEDFHPYQLPRRLQESQVDAPLAGGNGGWVFATVRQFGFPIQVLSDYTQAMNRYAFLLVE